MAGEPAASAAPRVTVLIAAFNRQEYLLRAVRSALASTLRRSDFEVVVVKNFRNPEIDAFLDEQAVRVLNEGPAPVGAWMARALTVARGTIICLLNDDDEFEPGKLAAVVERFGKEPALVYYHDRRMLVDPTGVAVPTEGRWERPQRAPFALVSAADRLAKIGHVHRVRGLFHDSCISVDRRVLEGHADRLSQVVVSEDVFTYFCALATDGTLFFDNRRLTRFRVHARSKYREEKTGPRAAAVTAGRWALIAGIEEITRGTPAERAARLFRIVTTHQVFLETDGGARPRAAEYWELWVFLVRYRVPSHAILLGLSVLKVVAPRMTGAFFARFWAFLDDRVT